MVDYNFRRAVFLTTRQLIEHPIERNDRTVHSESIQVGENRAL